MTTATAPANPDRGRCPECSQPLDCAPSGHHCPDCGFHDDAVCDREFPEDLAARLLPAARKAARAKSPDTVGHLRLYRARAIRAGAARDTRARYWALVANLTLDGPDGSEQNADAARLQEIARAAA